MQLGLVNIKNFDFVSDSLYNIEQRNRKKIYKDNTMAQERIVENIIRSKPVIEGAGVHLKRAFGSPEVPMFDPFLLLDDFHSSNPKDYMAGFPWHPHRGIETVTYIINGSIEHGDSLGNKGVISSGDVQWMTAGSGIIHQEMPEEYKGFMQGFQLWVNLPASEKMMEPRYRDVLKDEISDTEVSDGVSVKIIAGEINGVRGPVQDIVVNIFYFDITMQPEKSAEFHIPSGMKAFAYIYDGSGQMDNTTGSQIDKETVVIFGHGEVVKVKSGKELLRFLLISGEPISEPVAWQGPIVMNTQEELNLAFREYREGSFIK